MRYWNPRRIQLMWFTYRLMNREVRILPLLILQKPKHEIDDQKIAIIVEITIKFLAPFLCTLTKKCLKIPSPEKKTLDRYCEKERLFHNKARNSN